ncbi:MAG: HlyD family efflux transporter periplasmic adaptor subunit [Planctomycetes bacterium]|nr:HlyD family efflux transporter periplasmic adaptor subunit [Planctomycetota bacterium]
MSTRTTQGRTPHTDRRRNAVMIAMGLFMLAVLVGGIVFLTRTNPQQEVAVIPQDRGPQAERPEAPAVIRGRGIVKPKVRLEIMPEVAGKVIYTHSQLRAGGLIRANEMIAQIDSSGYELAVRRAQAAVDEAQARLDLELAAKGMPKLQGRSLDVENQVDLPAVLHEPLIRQAVAVLESAKADLAMAQLQLSRTSIMLPFDVLVAGETASLGQYAQVGRSLAVAYGTEAFEIEVAVKSEDLARLGGPELPEMPVEVKGIVADREYIWPGEALRTTRQVDPESGATSIVVEVPRPMEASADRPALLPGTVVEVLFPGGQASGDSNGAENVGER